MQLGRLVEILSESIEKLWSISSCDLILLGDFNVNILSPTLSTQHRYLNNLISDFNLRNMITSPTRTPSQSCLDLILAPVHLPKDYKVISSSITSLDGLTDHHLVGISMALPLHKSPRNKHVHKYRSPPLHKADVRGLLSHISRAFQTTDISCMSLDEATAFWQRSILAGLDAECPEVQARSSSKPRPPPWMTPELQRLQRQRKLTHRQSIQNPTNTYLRQQFRSVRRQGTKLNKELRSRYYLQRFHSSKDSPREHWNLLNSLLGRKPIQTALPVSTSELTNTFASLVTNTLSCKPCPIPLGPAQASGLTALRAVSVTEVQRLLEAINSNSATGSDNIPPRLLKTCAHHLAPSVTLLFNESLCMGQVPACFKHASVVPIYKKGDRSLATNYRPISLLPSLSKILERLVLTQLRHLVSQTPGNLILPPEQFAYRANHSCEDLYLCK